MADASGELLIAKSDTELHLLLRMANRHGLISGATGTGKTVTLQVLAERFSAMGVPVFAADVKGDLSGISQPGGDNPKVVERAEKLGLAPYDFHGSPVAFWDVYGEQGHPVRTTVTELGPLLISRLLNLNDIQEGVLNVAFRVADDNGLLLLDLKDLRSILQFVGDNSSDLTTAYGNVSAASVGAIQRGLLALENQGANELLGEPALDLFDLIQTDSQGRGVINILAADKLMTNPKVYSTFLLWLLSELFERLEEVGDSDKPRLVFFFDEAHLLFDDAPDALLQKVEQVVRLIRSKGVGVYFITQNPIDIPDAVLGQLGNKIQHALRAFTPKDQKAVRAMAETFRQNPDVDVETVVTELGVGEALVSVLQDDGSPMPVQRALIVPPYSRIGAITAAERDALVRSSVLFGHYEKEVDRDSAYEQLKARAEQAESAAALAAAAVEQAQLAEKTAKPAPPAKQASGRKRESMVEAMGKSAIRALGSQVGRQIARGVLGTILGGAKK